MPDTTILLIQTRHEAEARVLEISGACIRVGAGSQCELRLVEAGLIDVECVLLRRGRAWSLQVSHPTGSVTLNGRPVEGLRPLPYGTSVRVGGTLITLRPAGIAPWVEPDYKDPAPADSTAADAPRLEPIDVDTELAEPERARDWQSRLEERERWLKARREERRWQARWKAAGEALRSRPASKPAPEETPLPRQATPPRARREPAVPPSPPVEEPTPAILALPQVRQLPDKPATEFRVQPPMLPFERPGAIEPAPPIEEERLVPTLRVEIPDSDIPPSEDVHEVDDSFHDAGLDDPVANAEPEAADVAAAPVSETPREEEPPSHTPAQPQSRATVGRPAPRPVPELRPFPAEHAESMPEVGPFVASTVEASSGAWHTPPTPAQGLAPHPGPPIEEWPSVRDVLGDRRAAADEVPERKQQPRPRAAKAPMPEPTEARAPDAWSVPVWAAWVPAALTVVVLGTVGLRLAWTWGNDDYNAGLIADSLLREGADADKAIDVPPGPAPSWWSSTPSHMYLRALAQARAAQGSQGAEEVPSLLHAAHHSAPLDPSVRLAMAESAAPGDAQPLAALGMSRDAVALRQTGRRLLAAGKTDAGLRAYRSALEIAVKTDLARAPMPAFDDDRDVRRFALPLEDTIGSLVRDLDERTKEGYARWRDALPDHPIVALSALRLLRLKGDAEAEKLADRLAAMTGETGSAEQTAILRAAQAESLALAGRWKEAAERYREAINLMPVDLIRRSWWLNLGEIAGEADDRDLMRTAWESACGPSPKDGINIQVVRARAHYGVTITADAGNAPAEEPAPFPGLKR